MSGPPPVLSWLALFFLGASSLLAQDRDSHPLPQLGPDADARDARAYYEYGIERTVEHPDSAANAFYWASRLDPTWAQAWYARWVALHLSDRKRLYHYTRDNEDVLTSPEVLRIDSLYFRALQLNPFFFRRMAYLWNETFWRQAVVMKWSRMPYSNAELNYILDSLLTEDTTTHVRAWLAYSERQFRSALGHYARLLGGDEDDARIRAWRGHTFFLLRQYDSAQVAFNEAIDELRQRDEDEFVILYESKAMLEYALGRAFEAAGNRQGATEAYSRSLLEDLAFYPAHQRLGVLALSAGDTVAAVSEFEFAAQTDPTAPVPRVWLGSTLYSMGRYQEAVPALEQAIALEPYWAEPYYILGHVLEALGDREGALLSYASFAGLAKATDDRHALVTQKISTLKEP